MILALILEKATHHAANPTEPQYIKVSLRLNHLQQWLL